MKLFYWYLHYIYDLILYLCIMYYTVCYLAGIFYAVVRQISMLFIDSRISVFCINLRQICDERLNKVERYGLQKYYRTPFAYQNVSSMRPCAKSKWPGCVTWLTGSSAKARKLYCFSFCLFNLIRCWTLFIAAIVFGMAKYILKTTQTFGSKMKH